MLLIFSNPVNAQGPNSPEASSFEPVDATDMVNLLTGDFTYVLPLLNVPSPEGGYPLTLSYHAGVAMDQEASWVGLGWSLNPGAINRNVNGYPDDWRTGTIKDFAYDEGGSEYSSAISIGYGVSGKWSIGIGVSWGSNRSLGGSVQGSVGVFQASVGTEGVGVGIGMSNNLSVGASIGYNGGFGLSASFFTSSQSNVGFSIGIQSGSNGITGSFGVSSRSFLLDKNAVARSSIGISLSSSGLAVNSIIAGFGTGEQRGSNSQISPSDYEVNSGEYNIGLTTPWGYFSYGINTVSWRLRTITRTHVDGAIHPYANYEQSTEYRGNASGQAPAVSNLRSMDVFEVNTNSNFELNRQDSYLDSNNGVLINSDNYMVNSQGVSGSISPVIGNNLNLYPLVNSGEYKQGYFVEYSADVNSLGKVKEYEGYRPPINFSFQSHGGSYLNVLPYDLSYSTSQGVTYNMPTPSFPIDFSFDSQQKLLYNNSSYDIMKNRKKDGNYIEYFTVEQINSGEAASRGFLDVDDNFVRDLNSIGYNNDLTNNIDSRLYLHQNFQASIAAFKITTPDGKTYHYSLPVYQGEQVRRVFGIVDNKTEDQANLDRMNINAYATHWLLTAITGPDYIKTDLERKYADEGDLGYWVRFEYGKWSNGYIWKTEIEPVDVFGKAKEYSWGRKQIYYLDKIKTRTHTAIFIKDIRTDNKSAIYNYKNMYHRITQSSAFMQMDSNPLLRLDKIILLKNEDANLLNKNNGNQLIPVKSYDYFISGDFNKIIDSYGVLQGWKTPTNEHRRTYQANLSNNIFDKNDIVNSNVEQKALKIIKFNTDYSLCVGSPNSSSGKLTLKNISFLGKAGASVFPPIKFQYLNKPYSIDKKSDFGYYEDYPEAWSLNKITTPVGASINIEYEPDSYSKVAIKNSRVFTSKLKFTFITEPPHGNSSYWPEGITRIKIEVDNQDPEAVDIKLKDYFDSSKPFFMDMWYSAIYNHSQAGYDRSSVNIDAKMATIIELNDSQNYMIVDVMASSPNFRDVFQHSAEPVSVLHASGSYSGVENQNLPRYELAWTPNSGWRKYSMRHTIIANKNRSSNDCGIRVKQISINDNDKFNYTFYNYNNPQTGQTSGVIPYYPEKNYNIKQQVPYISLLPGPVVTYEHVQEYNNNVSKEFKFKVLEELTTTGNIVSFGDLLSIEINETNPNLIINLKQIKINNNLSSLGRIEKVTLSNSIGQILSKTINTYNLIPENFELGQFQESNYSSKDVRSYYTFSDVANLKEFYNVTTMLSKYSSLASIESMEKNYKSILYLDKYDFITGQVLETRTVTSDGKTFKTKIVPAYTKYPQMASKVDDINNRNMLTQTAASYSYIQDAGDWKVTGVGITTWNNIWSYQDVGGDVSSPTIDREKIWRKHKSYVWNGVKDNNGIFIDYNDSNDDDFDWTVGVGSQPTHWKQASEITLYDHYSMPLEVKDVNNNKAATKMDVLNQKIEANGNAAYSEMYYSGAEIFSGGGFWVGQEVRNTNGIRTDEKAHTGKYSIAATNNSQFGVFMRNGHRPGKYKISVWAHKDNYQKARLRWYNNDAVNTFDFNGEKVFAGDWVLLNHYTDVYYMDNAHAYWYVNSEDNSTVYFDDLMIRPIASSITGYVYNEYDELTHIIGNNGLATRFEYDAAGRLVKTYVEIVDDPANSVIGGFKLKSENKYHYKNL